MPPTEYRATFDRALGEAGTFRLSSSGVAGDRSSDQIVPYVVSLRRFNLPTDHVAERSRDLVDLLQAIYLVDRLCPRSVRHDPRLRGARWERRITVQIPVRDPVFFLSARMQSLLVSILSYLTRDEWIIQPVPYRAPDIAPARPLALLTSQDIVGRSVVLHSGGLDALLGLALSRRGNQGETLAVSVSTHSHMAALQHEVARSLAKVLPTFQYVGVTVSYESEHRIEDKESSQRTRTLRCVAAGALAALSVGEHRLVVAENGPGAINPPVNIFDAAPHLSRGLHPYAMRLLAELMAVTSGCPVSIENPLLPLSKGQVVEQLVDLGLTSVLLSTNSCERFPYRSARDHCGRCSSCILRSVAMWSVPPLRQFVSASTAVRTGTALTHYRLSAVTIGNALAAKDPIGHLRIVDPKVDEVVAALGQEKVLELLATHRNEIVSFCDAVSLVAA